MASTVESAETALIGGEKSPAIVLPADPPLTCEVRVSRRARRLRLRVRPQRIEVVVPRGLSPRGRTVRRFVEANADWLLSSREEADRQHLEGLLRRFSPGAAVPFRGEELLLVVREGARRRRVRRTDAGYLEVDLPERVAGSEEPLGSMSLERLKATRDAVEGWLKCEARKHLHRIAPGHLQRLGVTARSVRLGTNRRAWGTCSGRGIVRVHWRLVQAPPEAMEYVVAHEVAHLVEANHSPAFWGALERTLPTWWHGKAALEVWESLGAERGVSPPKAE